MEECLRLESKDSKKFCLESYYNSFKELLKKEAAQREDMREINADLARKSKNFFAQLMLKHLPDEIDGLLLERSVYIREDCKKDCEKDCVNIMNEKEIESKIESPRNIEE